MDAQMMRTTVNRALVERIADAVAPALMDDDDVALLDDLGQTYEPEPGSRARGAEPRARGVIANRRQR